LSIPTSSKDVFTVLWDNDGVLVDTEGLYFRASRMVLATVGVDLTPERFIEISLCRGASTFQLAEERGIDADEISCLRAERDRLYVDLLRTDAHAVEGIEEVLRSLYGRVRMGVVTSTHRAHFEVAHARTGLKRYLDFVVAHEDYCHSKPHPEPYLTALTRYGIQPGRCLAVEDSPRGLVSATAAGLECVVVRSEWTRGGDFRKACCVLDHVSAVADEVLRRAHATPGAD